MPFAIKTARVKYEGRYELVREGVSWVEAGHELVRTYPELWGAETKGYRKPGRRHVTRQPSASPQTVKRTDATSSFQPHPTNAPTSRFAETRIELRDGNPTQRIKVYPSAIDAIRNQARVSRDGKETGGLLFGPRLGLEISNVGPCGPNADRREGSMRFDGAHDMELAREIAALSDGKIRECGSWHTHPGFDGRPSPRDLEAFAGMRDLLGLTRFIAIIVTPHRDQGWSAAKLNGWVLREGFGGFSLVCERAQL